MWCLRLGTGALLLLSACDIIFVKIVPPCFGLKSAVLRPKDRLKAAICFAENLPCHHVALAARNIREYSKQNFEQVWWPTSSKAHTRSRYLAAQENPTTIWEGRQHKTHNFVKVEVRILHWMFFCDNVSQKHFRIFFNWEIDTCRRYAHLITGSYIKKDENMWLMGIPLDSFAQLEF